MLHLVGLDVFGEIAGDVEGTVVGQQARSMGNKGLVASRCRQRQVQRVGHILGANGGAELPGDDVSREKSSSTVER